MKFEGKIILIGGSGTLGTEFMKKAKLENWPCDITVYSRNWKKQHELKRIFPEVTFIVGDVLNYELLKMAIAGHDLAIHMAAMKDVVEGEKNALAVFDTNVAGSQNVLAICTELGVDVIGISTDKSCAPVNCYGASKMMMERMFQQYAAGNHEVKYHLVRYGNVFGSAGSFIHNWLYDMQNLGYVRSTDPDMTRFWLTADDALELIWASVGEPTGCTLIPVAKAALIGDIEEWLIPDGIEVKHSGMRPGEKRHECLLSEEETRRATVVDIYGKRFVRLYPATYIIDEEDIYPMYSDDEYAQLTKEEFLELAGMTGDELANDHS